MALTVLRLLEGDPFGRDAAKDYKLAKETVDGETEDKLRAEIACFSLLVVREEVYDDDSWGKYEEEVFRATIPFAEMSDSCIVYGDRLAGVAFGNKLVFVPKGNIASGVSSVLWETSTARSDTYERETLTLIRTAPTPYVAYYEEKDGNPHHTLVGTDELAESLTVHEDTVKLERHAFDDCNKLRSVSISAGVKEIEHGALCCDNLEEITVSAANKFFRSVGNCLIQTEEKLLLSGCNNSIIPDDGSVVGIGFLAFADRRLEADVFVIPEGVSYIGQNAFYSTEFNSIMIPKSLKEADIDAFSYCKANGNVYYRGTEEEWNNIRFCIKNSHHLFRIPRYYYSETRPDTEGNFWHFDGDGKVTVW